jgi:hypothetical protein
MINRRSFIANSGSSLIAGVASVASVAAIAPVINDVIPDSETTVCTQCKNFMNLEPTSPRKDVWYNHLCKTSPLPTKTDPYDGKKKPFASNSIGNEFFLEEKEGFKFCRDVNNGRCSKFQAI